jgi:hypothetical protein
MPAISSKASKSAALPTIAASVVDARTARAPTTTASVLFVFLHQTVGQPVLAVPLDG